MSTNYTKLADLYAVATAKAEQAAKEREELRQRILASGEAELIGDAFALTISRFEVSRLSTEKAKAFLTPAQIRKCTSASESSRITVKAAAPVDFTPIPDHSAAPRAALH